MANRYPSGPKGYLFTTREFRTAKNRVWYLIDLCQQYGDLFHYEFVPGRHGYMINRPEYVHQILVEQPDNFEKGPSLKQHAKQTIGQGLLTSEADFHKRQRRLVQPAFHHQRVLSYADTMVELTESMLKEWRSGQEIEINRAMMKLTLAIINRTMFGADVSDEADEIGDVITSAMETVISRVSRPINLPLWVPTKENRRRVADSRFVTQTITRIINDRKQSGKDHGDLLSMLLLATDEEGGTGQMTAKQARDEVVTLFIAGHETTANLLTWTWYLLSQNPAAETALHEELDRVLAGRAPTAADLDKLPTTDWVVKESLRLYPPAWIIGREVVNEFQLGDYTVPKHSIITMSPYVMHRNPRYFAEPDQFKPERWANNFEKSLPRFAYFPFGGGPRVCIGQGFALMEARLLLAAIAQRYRLELMPDQQVEIQPLVTLRPKGEIAMRIVERERMAVPQSANT